MYATRHHYRGFDLSIDSSFAIPGAVPTARGQGNAEIVIRAGSAEIGNVDAAMGPYTRSGQALRLDVPGVARYLALSPGELIIEPCLGAEAEDVSALLVATALPMLLWMRGGIVLHAAGVVLPGAQGALALAGPSGIGKSTLARRLVERGAAFVGDDSLHIASAQSGPTVSGLSASCFLPDADDRMLRLLHPIPASAQAARGPLAAIVIVARAEGRPVAPPQCLGVSAALEAVLQNRHRPRVPAILGRHAALLPDIVALSRAVPVYRLEVPEGDVAAAEARMLALAAALGGPG